MNQEIENINLNLACSHAGNMYKVGEKASEVRLWIRSLLSKIVYYKAQHRSYLIEAAATLQPALPNDIVLKNVLPFIELPSYTFEGEN